MNWRSMQNTILKLEERNQGIVYDELNKKFKWIKELESCKAILQNQIFEIKKPYIQCHQETEELI